MQITLCQSFVSLVPPPTQISIPELVKSVTQNTSQESNSSSSTNTSLHQCLRPASITRPSRSSRQSKTACIPGKLECAAQAKILAQKRRVPLATKISLPRKLPRPVLGEVDLTSLAHAYPNLTGVPADTSRHARAALQAVKTSGVCSSSLPKELEIIMNNAVAAACPTHMLAKRHVSLFPHAQPRPAHALRPPPDTLPRSQPSTSSPSANHPPSSPSASHHPKRSRCCTHTSTPSSPPPLRASLAYPCESASDLLQLATHASKIHGLWRNACTLGVVDPQLYDVIEASACS
ncbi:hypothetical protein B0H14DRAFT_2932101 [Mycena olivaceomarginata]|nr:hypothetical protein B0H14DRAFT_2932101 [Mycena olivaceomarginata]